VEDQGNKEDIRGDHVEEDNMKGASLSMTKEIDFLSILGRFVGTYTRKNRESIWQQKSPLKSSPS
jgi:hypothetical protein